MSKMIEVVDDMRARLGEVARTDQTLVRALDDALRQVDLELLADVRDLTLAHEARRVAILAELQGLAERIGSFPAAREPQPALEAHTAPLSASLHATTEAPASPRPGDWRQAVSNIKDDLDTYFGRDVQH